jgi:hypothetical protein
VEEIVEHGRVLSDGERAEVDQKKARDTAQHASAKPPPVFPQP